ncbi:MAG: glycosyltransferase family 1 protein [Aureliella sp.]
MRIGIWCDYGFTLEPSEGIGVFVDNLARGIIRADSQTEIVMMSHPGQEDRLSSTVASGQNRISVVSVPRLSQPWRRIVRSLKKLQRRLSIPSEQGRIAASIVGVLQTCTSKLSETQQRAIIEHVDSCDVWLLPYVCLDQEFTKPTVVAIHDLVCYHFPEMLSPTKLASLKFLVDQVSQQATLAVCMSKFICENDLLGTLQLPPSRVRVLEPAVPDDFGLTSDAPIQHLPNPLSARGVAPDEPYLLYPAAFRSYKNHAYLLHVLQQLRQQSDTRWKLVFTGIQECPRELTTQIEKLHLEGHVLSLGKVTRGELESLYRSAFVTVVPSLYEQGSFPVMEALNCQCPVACSNIPSLLEQFNCMGESMLYFDPHQPRSLVSVINQIERNRDQVIAEQSIGFTALRRKTWDQAAKGWLDVFREALSLQQPIGNAWPLRRAA